MSVKNCLKAMMITFNGAIFLAGAGVLSLGVWEEVDNKSLMRFLNDVDADIPGFDQLISISYLFIIVGLILTVIGFLGCCGAIKENRCMLLMFCLIVLVIFIIQFIISVILLARKDWVKYLTGHMVDQIKEHIQENYGANEDDTIIWNQTMQEFKCCGFTNYTDFNGSPHMSASGNSYPTFCCNMTMTVDGNCTAEIAQQSPIEGCYVRLTKFLTDNGRIIGIVALAITVIEIASVLVSLVLYKSTAAKH